MEIALIVVIALVLAAEFVNGWTDAPNAITTVVSTRTLTFKQAVTVATVLNIAGVMTGTAVAKTIGKGFVESEAVNLTTIAAAMSAIILWSTTAWIFGLPTSESHALVAALTGAGLATAGFDALLFIGWRNVLIGLFFSTFLGFIAAYLLTKVIRKGVAPFPLKTTKPAFRWLQVLSSAFMAFSHGSNDGQKFIGVFALTLVIGGFTDKFSIPYWVVIVCALTMGIGTSLGGWRIIRTMGIKMVKIDTYQGFAAETGAGATITLASFLTLPLPGGSLNGIPLSTTHTIGTSIVGTSVARRKTSFSVGVFKKIALAWILTFPICGISAFLLTLWIQHPIQGTIAFLAVTLTPICSCLVYLMIKRRSKRCAGVTGPA